MRIGLIARADNTGLGIQTHEFYKNMQPAKTMVVDISRMNGNIQYPDRYPERAVFIDGFPTENQIGNFLHDLDVVFLAEAPYNFALYTMAKQMSVKVANQYNYEFFDWFANPHLPRPDMLIAPSMWHFEEVDQWCKAEGIMHGYLHCPVNRKEVPFRRIDKARTFVHNAGRAASYDRNGTRTVIEASRHLDTPAQIVIRFQAEQGLKHQTTGTIEEYAQYAEMERAKNLTIQTVEYANYADAYETGDVMLLPRRYGGNCLPLNEALSAGMPVIMPDISPNNFFLPNDWTLPARHIETFTPRTEVEVYEVNPALLARKIDEFYRMDEEHMLDENEVANQLAESISWETLRPQYLEAFERLLQWKP